MYNLRMNNHISFLVLLVKFICHLKVISFLRCSVYETQFFFYESDNLSDLNSFPTRRSSDLSHTEIPHDAGNVLPADLSDYRSQLDRKSTRLNSSHVSNSYAVFCLKKKTKYGLYLLYEELSRF